MESTKPPEVVPVLSSSPTRFEIVFAEDPKNALALVSPPLSDIQEMSEFQQLAFSLKEDGPQLETLRAAAEQRLMELSGKMQRFQGSATFHNRLANLFNLIGDAESERESSERAVKLSDEPFFVRKVGELRARSGDIEGAKKIFHDAWSRDSYAALRLASFGVIERDFEQAERWLNAAISINPIGYAERLFQGALSLVRSDFAGAIAAFRMALGERPNSSVAYSNLGLAYIGINRPDRAMRSLKRAVALDPFNKSALVALADVCTVLDCSEHVINSLKYYVEFEQKDEAVWARLARCLLREGHYADAINALKMQGAINPTVGLWNNLGVAYFRNKDHAKSVQAFKHALSLEAEGGVAQELFVAKNIASLLANMGQYEQVLTVTDSILDQDVDFAIARDEKIAEIYAIHINALRKLNRNDDAFFISSNVLDVRGAAPGLIRWVVFNETSALGLSRDNDKRLSALLDRVKSDENIVRYRDLPLVNNVAFGLAEIGRLDEAAALLNKASSALHKDAYLTATLGLINIRKGNIRRAEALYHEAVQLAKTSNDKARIRQKMNVELGRALMKNDVRRGKRFLEKAATERGGEKILAKQANAILAGVGRLKK